MPWLLLLVVCIALVGCSSCSHQLHDHQLRLQLVQREILHKMHLSDRPANVSEAVSRRTLARTRLGLGDISAEAQPQEEVASSDAISVIISLARQGPVYNRSQVLNFYRGSDVQDALTVSAASLWMEVEPRGKRQNPRATIRVFSVLNNNKEKKLVSKRRVRVQRERRWVKLEVAAAVQSWFSRRRRGPLQLLVKCTGGCRAVTTSSFIRTSTRPAASRRRRRTTRDCTSSTPAGCCRQQLYISFKQLGWTDWIIHPRGYHANYCIGSCSSSGNAHRQLLRTYSSGAAQQLPTGCCVPTKMAPLAVIYFDTKMNIVSRRLSNMIVEECGCM